MTTWIHLNQGGECTTSGVSELQSILNIYQDEGAAELLKARVLLVVHELASGPYLHTLLGRMLAKALEKCLDNSTPTTEAIEAYPSPSFPVLSWDALESLFFSAAYLFSVFVVVVFESHESYTGKEWTCCYLNWS